MRASIPCVTVAYWSVQFFRLMFRCKDDNDLGPVRDPISIGVQRACLLRQLVCRPFNKNEVDKWEKSPQRNPEALPENSSKRRSSRSRKSRRSIASSGQTSATSVSVARAWKGEINNARPIQTQRVMGNSIFLIDCASCLAAG